MGGKRKQKQHKPQPQNKQSGRQDRQSRNERNRNNRETNKASWYGSFYKLSSQLKRMGLQIREWVGDGNCMFRAVSDQIIGTEFMYMDYRGLCVDHIIQEKDFYQFFIEDDESFDSYVSSMAKNGAWGGNIELQALSNVLGVNITIYQVNEPPWEITNFPETARRIHLSYHDGDHYNSVRVIGDTGQTPAMEVPAHMPLIENSQEMQEAEWNDMVNYVKIMSNFQEDEKILSVLQSLFPDDVPSPDQVCEEFGTISNLLYKKAKAPYARNDPAPRPRSPPAPQANVPTRPVHSVEEMKSLGFRPAKLPRNNENCWCGTGKKYKKWCKAKDTFRDIAPEVPIEEVNAGIKKLQI